MLGTVLHGPRDVRFEEVQEPTILHPTDAIIRLPATCICGSDQSRPQRCLRGRSTPSLSKPIVDCSRAYEFRVGATIGAAGQVWRIKVMEISRLA
jgi:hypothetical protein